VGIVEISDIVFATQGPQIGAILIEWNIHEPEGMQAGCGMWGVQTRIGGVYGTNMLDSSIYNGTFLLLHITSGASGYFENNLFWVSDYVIDKAIEIVMNEYNERGVLVESQGPV
jgi:hypothetical protein